MCLCIGLELFPPGTLGNLVGIWLSTIDVGLETRRLSERDFVLVNGIVTAVEGIVGIPSPSSLSITVLRPLNEDLRDP